MISLEFFPLPSSLDVVVVSCIIGIIQLAVAIQFHIRRRTETKPDPMGRYPSAALIIPVTGPLLGLDDCIASFLNQDYGGKLEIIFVTPSKNDPAYKELESLAHLRKLPSFKLIATNLVPSSAGGKPLDLSFAVDSLSEAVEIILFADIDVNVKKDWAKSLVHALLQPDTGVATSMTPNVRTDSFSGLLRMAWLAYGIPYLELNQIAVGQSLAIRADDARNLKLSEHWSKALSEDMALSRLAQGWGKRIVFCGNAIAPSIEGMEQQSLVGVFNRWTSLFRIYRPGVWLLGFLLTSFKLYATLRLAQSNNFFLLAPIPILLDALYLLIVLKTFETFTSELKNVKRAKPFRCALTAPFLIVLHAINFLSSTVSRNVTWGAYRYRVKGPFDITAIPR